MRRSLIMKVALVAAFGCFLSAPLPSQAWAADAGLYPDWSAGSWGRSRATKGGTWDPDKPRGLAQQTLHDDDEAIVNERMFLDKADPTLMRNEITVIDHALTRPWTVTRTYHHVTDAKWVEYICAEDNHHVVIDHEDYLISENGFLMPTQKNQKPPDLRNFAGAKN